MSPADGRPHNEHVAAGKRGDLQAALDLYDDDCYLQHVSLGFRVEGRDAMAAYDERIQAAGATSKPRSAELSWVSRNEDGRAGADTAHRHGDLPLTGACTGEHLVVDAATRYEQAGFDLLAVLGAAAGAPFPRREAWAGLPTHN